ncbi:hypothetical protein GPALN_011063, partial [Globodera pallida]
MEKTDETFQQWQEEQPGIVYEGGKKGRLRGCRERQIEKMLHFATLHFATVTLCHRYILPPLYFATRHYIFTIMDADNGLIIDDLEQEENSENVDPDEDDEAAEQ